MADDEVRPPDDDAEGGATTGEDDPSPGPIGAEGATAGGTTGGGRTTDGLDLRGIVKQFTAPMLESLDSRLREQIETHADEVLTAKVDAAITDRLQTIDRAIAALSRAIDDLERRVASIERAGETLD